MTIKFSLKITESETPKPVSTARYIVCTTIWAALFPGLLISSLIFFLVCIGTFGIPFLFLPALFFLILFLSFTSALNDFRKHLAADLRTGNVPPLFSLQILPFWLPLFYSLLITAIAFYFESGGYGRISGLTGIMLFAFPHYSGWILLMWFAITMGGSWGIQELIPAVPCAVSLITAAAGTAAAAVKNRSVFRQKVLLLYSGITVLLFAAVFFSCIHFRTEILYPFENKFSYGQEKVQVVLDETFISRYRRTEPELSAYRPFSENNKLIKIHSPSLQIESEYPSIDTVSPLYPVCAAAVEAVYKNAEKSGNFNPLPSLTREGLHSTSSSAAFADLLSKSTKNENNHIVMMFEPSEKQLHEAAAASIPLTVTPLGYDAFVFFVNESNPVDDLSTEQIRRIYSGKITRWNEIGGRNERIIPFQRPEGLSIQTMMLRVMDGVPLVRPQREETRYPSCYYDYDVAAYRNYPNAIGYSFRCYVDGLFRHKGIKLLKVNGIVPSRENVQNGTYPFTGKIVIITRKDNSNPNIPLLTDWFLSPQGQELLDKAGYVPLIKRCSKVLDKDTIKHLSIGKTTSNVLRNTDGS